MKKINLLIYLTIFFSLFNCSLESKPKIEGEINEDAEVASIKAVLFHQQENWNNGNIRGFMDGYWKSEQLMFKSANHKTSYGWEAVYQRYKESYPDKESMGILKFTIKDVSLINSVTANLHGDWELERKNDHPAGSFWLNLSKKENKWVITTDSTISFHP